MRSGKHIRRATLREVLGPNLGRIIRMLNDDIQEVLRSHHPNQPATAADIAVFEQTHGFSLDPELQAFYAACNGAKLFRDFDSPYWILPLDRILTAKIALYGSEIDAPDSPDDVYAFCDVLDGNYAGFAVRTGKLFPIYDVFHESWHLPDHRDVIAGSFAEFLHRALRSNGSPYWLKT